MNHPLRLLSFDEYLAGKAVRIGRLWCSPRSVETTLHRHCKKIVGVTDMGYGYPGSSTAVAFEKRCLLFCCGHQIGSFNPDQIGIWPSYNREWIITGNSMVIAEASQQIEYDELIDVRSFNFPVESYEIPSLRSEFFDIQESEIWKPGRERVFIVYGYPTEFQDIGFDEDSGENTHVHARCMQTTGFYDGPSNAPHVHRLTMSRRGSFDADGMSGGTVFYLGVDGNGFFVGLAGMIIRGSRTSNIIHFIEVSAIKLFASHVASKNKIDAVS
ncbi:hypothetical protein [Methylocystis heyeri]|uniref:Serine protease n=1 Tax=Methylocystis heyeri TaxID=391905 RepID=A0A6B8KDB2_9HYPH|nr:hypothetical protein [Methylocystis heyeri]QGM44538.1 hypothetical protein H2LOC_001860 [Methylocystis heyeri]